MGKAKYAFITAIPMCFVGVTTLTAGVLSIKNIYLPLAQKPGHGFQGYLDSTLMVIFVVGVVLVLIECGTPLLEDIARSADSTGSLRRTGEGRRSQDGLLLSYSTLA